MSDSQSPDEASDPGNQPAPGNAAPLRARVPDHVADGVFSTGVIVMTGPNEFIVDFLQTIGRPHRIARRVIIPHPVMPQFIEALNTNLDLYRNRFGDPPVPPPQSQDAGSRRPTPQDIYDDLKMPDEVLSGTYANGVMIGHGASEFGLDFLTSFFPQSAVSARVFLSAGQVPRLLESLRGAAMQLQQRRDATPSPGGPAGFPGGAANVPPEGMASDRPDLRPPTPGDSGPGGTGESPASGGDTPPGEDPGPPSGESPDDDPGSARS